MPSPLSPWQATQTLYFSLPRCTSPAANKFDENTDPITNKIKNELVEAETLRIEAEKELKKFQVMQNEAVEDAKRIIADAHEAAERIRNAAVEKAKESIKRRENQAKAKIAASEAAVLAELKMRATSIAISASKEILVSELNDDLNSSIIDESISQIKAAQ